MRKLCREPKGVFRAVCQVVGAPDAFLQKIEVAVPFPFADNEFSLAETNFCHV